MEQAWLRGDNVEVRAARQAFEDLALRVRDIASRTPAEQRQAFVLSHRDEFQRALQSLARHSEQEIENRRSRDVHGVEEDFECLRLEACMTLLAWPR